MFTSMFRLQRKQGTVSFSATYDRNVSTLRYFSRGATVGAKSTRWSIPSIVTHLNRGASTTPRRAALRLMIGSIDVSAVGAVSLFPTCPMTGRPPTHSQEVARTASTLINKRRMASSVLSFLFHLSSSPSSENLSFKTFARPSGVYKVSVASPRIGELEQALQRPPLPQSSNE